MFSKRKISISLIICLMSLSACRDISHPTCEVNLSSEPQNAPLSFHYTLRTLTEKGYSLKKFGQDQFSGIPIASIAFMVYDHNERRYESGRGYNSLFARADLTINFHQSGEKMSFVGISSRASGEYNNNYLMAQEKYRFEAAWAHLEEKLGSYLGDLPNCVKTPEKK